MDPITVLTGVALATSAAASGISAMISWWNWKQLKTVDATVKEVTADVKGLKQHAAMQVQFKEKMKELRKPIS